MNLFEQETIINISRTEKGASIWTSDNTMMTKLDKLCARSENYTSQEQRSRSGELLAKEYFIADKALIFFRAERRTLTDEQREKAAARLRDFKNNQNSALCIGQKTN